MYNDKSMLISMTNYHNGYYPHDYFVDYKIFSEDNKLIEKYISDYI